MTLDNNQSLVKTMSIFLIPLLLSNILQSIGQLVSIVLVGRWIGEDAVSLPFLHSFRFSFYSFLFPLALDRGARSLLDKRMEQKMNRN